MLRIPKNNADLRRYACWKNLKYLLFFLFYVAFWSFAFVYYYMGRYEHADPWAWWMFLLFGAIILISGWIICCMSRFLFDRSLIGRITDEKYVRNYGRGLSRKGKLSVDFHTYIRIRVITAKGKRKNVTFPLFDDGYDGYYRSGGTLIKFRGLTYPLCLESEEEGVRLCGVCGVRTFYKDGHVVNGEAEPLVVDGKLICRCCGKTMISIQEIAQKGV